MTAFVRVARWLAGLMGDAGFVLLGAALGLWSLALILGLLAVVTQPSALIMVLPLVCTLRFVLPLERRRLRLAGLTVAPDPPPPPTTGPGRFLRLLTGPVAAHEVRYLGVLALSGPATLAVCGGLWMLAASGTWSGADARWVTILPDELAGGPAPGWAVRAGAVLLLVPAAALLTRALAAAQVRIARDRLVERPTVRVEQVLASRARAVAAQTTELRRIERDLHDGAQARLVALSMQLGLLERALRPLGPPAEVARDRLSDCVGTTQAALSDLRHLVRGIHPPILTDRGLGSALEALAADSVLPVDLDHPGSDERLAASVESAAYFVVTEAVTNAAKHADATHCGVRLTRDRDSLTIVVSDDGRGGADPHGAGLTGLRHRVEALDGTLDMTSPPGGPTTIEVRLPCA